jgi:hypothetical protein
MAIVPELRDDAGRRVPERMWIGSAPDYGTWGGTLAWLDPRTLAHASHRNIVQDCYPYSMLWLPAERQLVLGISNEGGTGTRPKAHEGGFAIWDPANDRLVYSGNFGIRDIPGVFALVPAGPGRVYALIGRSQYTAAMLHIPVGPIRITLVDLASRRVLSESTLPDDFGGMTDQCQFCLFAGPDGVYGVTAHTFYRVKAGTCEVQAVWRAASGDEIDTPGPWIGRTFIFATGWRLRSLTLP